MDIAKWPAITGLLIGTVLTTRAIPNSFAFDKVVHSSIATLAISGAAILGASRHLGKIALETDHKALYVPLHEIRKPHDSQPPSPDTDGIEEIGGVGYPSSLKKLRLSFAVLVLAICLRVEILREVVMNVQCSKQSLTPLLPILFALWNWWSTPKRSHKRTASAIDDDVDLSIYEVLERNIVNSSLSWLIAVLLVCLGGSLALRSTSVPPSTVICAAGLPFRRVVPHLQGLGSALDVVVVVCLAQLVGEKDSRDSSISFLRLAHVGHALLTSAGVLFFIGTIYFLAQAEDRHWIVMIPGRYAWSVLKLDFYISFTSVCVLITLTQVGLLTTALLATFTSVMTVTTASAWTNGHPFPPSPSGSAFLGICLMIMGFMSYVHVDSFGSSKGSRLFQRKPSVFFLTMIIIFLTWTVLWASHKTSVTFHPIDMLIYEAQSHHKAYLDQATASKSFTEAVVNYKQRYQRPPPPGFYDWYRFATERNAVVIDSFDSIHHDLLPFYGLTPKQIRDRTWELVANPYNDVAGISIRGGKVGIKPNVVPTHKWMQDGIVEMISKFAQWLPDMDLAFNLNDEPRVNMPYEKIKPMRQEGQYWGLVQAFAPKNKPFSLERGQNWTAIPDEPEAGTPLTELSWQRIFDRFGNNGCPPGSPARMRRKWDISSMCTSCAAPQSLGAFLANWTKAGDICHQPDVADLHGLFLSPAAFKATRDLYPIFSQSKTHGFNDILYPSAWNYLDKAKYNPNDDFPDKSFSEKDNILFWRGATSEGVSQGRGQWRGMTRQRFVHLANDINDISPSRPLLLPRDEDGKRWSYQNIPVAKLTELLPTDVQVVDNIARCAGEDCERQALEFAPLASPTDFQQHWRYKYLLDLDGAGFSGRFLAFLQSKSLPFKAALYREWWDDRLTPWLHFVPLDIRGHALWATLAYFHGVDGAIKGESGKTGAVEVKIDAHARDAERIAEAGRSWADEVLRKEDMEIYFFRLLLEWGRLTDDNRDEMGFELNLDGSIPTEHNSSAI